MFDPVKLIGDSAAMERLREDVRAAARTEAKVLITGESGVGKEIVSRLVHSAGRRAAFPLVTVNCAAITETLLESELFGHSRGSFTGAYRDRAGVLEMAHRGTVFMDEIGETSPRMQSLLLRFLENGEIQRVGTTKANARVDVRVIAATNRDLLHAVHAKTFREDLYYRLNVIHMTVPPLRDRIEDIPAMLDHFVAMFGREYSTPSLTFSAEARELLMRHQWPGNVRELKNLVERLTVRHGGRGVVTPADLPLEIRRYIDEPAATVKPGMSTHEMLFRQIVDERQSFWSVVYGPFMSRDLTRDTLRKLVGLGLQHTAGSYRELVELFRMAPADYKRFLNFLRKHQCHIAFQPFKGAAGPPEPGVASGEDDGVPRPPLVTSA